MFRANLLVLMLLIVACALAYNINIKWSPEARQAVNDWANKDTKWVHTRDRHLGPQGNYRR